MEFVLAIATFVMVIVVAIVGALNIDNAPIINLVLLAGLIAVTTWYAYATIKIARATKEQARASVKMAEGMARPAIDFQWQDSNSAVNLGALIEAFTNNVPSELRCKLCNIGVGPAIGLYSFTKIGQDNRHRYDFKTLMVGEQTHEVTLSVRQEGDSGVLEAYYKDVYGRVFKSSYKISVREGRLLGELRVEKCGEDKEND